MAIAIVCSFENVLIVWVEYPFQPLSNATVEKPSLHIELWFAMFNLLKPSSITSGFITAFRHAFSNGFSYRILKWSVTFIDQNSDKRMVNANALHMQMPRWAEWNPEKQHFQHLSCHRRDLPKHSWMERVKCNFLRTMTFQRISLRIWRVCSRDWRHSFKSSDDSHR